ncbi:MAG TPA: transcriptional coactivator p15/PC4 family protein [Candidatus Gastranaerophilales bacterium]|nr:transcriptional coactivator p15/PC4 family protein [Candidatus Gastranaerophilales bacterium]
MSDNKLLATIPRSATEQVQVQINEFKGKKYLDLRIYYTTDSGNTWNPTKKGVAIYPENLPALKDALEIAKKELENID